jgi:hypothetical protein
MLGRPMPDEQIATLAINGAISSTAAVQTPSPFRVSRSAAIFSPSFFITTR